MTKLAINHFPATKKRPWLSDDNVPYPHDMPYLYDRKNFPEVAVIEANWQVIRDELLAAIADGQKELVPYHDLEKTDKKASWHTAGLMYWTMVSKENTARFPKTWELFKRLPNLSCCSIHLLEPHSTIKPHIGDTDAMYRCHMGLIVPDALPRCGFRVGDKTVSWEEGKVFIFNDACEHTAWNNTSQNRYVISFDLMRPEFLHLKNWVSAQVLGKIHIEVLYQHLGWMRKYFAQPAVKAVLFALCKLHWRVRIALRASMPMHGNS
jgi:aspartyl/asparaginyl beta-hydroxylase (cupin superfamily)